MQQQGQIDPIIVTIFVVTGFLVNEISLLGLRQDAVLTIISICLILNMQQQRQIEPIIVTIYVVSG